MEVFKQLGNLVLNPNKATVGAIIHRCLINDGYCPCKPNRSEDHICPCNDAKEHDKCCCTLYVEKE